MSGAGAAGKEVRPIIVKKIKRVAGGHHGGAWKVAYADFVTAMMAFFMVMWLISSVNKEQRAAIYDYFKNPSMEDGKSSKAAPGQMGPGGASTSVINMGGGLDALRSSNKKTQGIGAPINAHSAAGKAESDAQNPDALSTGAEGATPTSEEEARRLTQAADRRKLESLMQDLQKAIDMSAELSQFKNQLLLDITSEGLRIQIVDAQNRPMFDLGSAALKNYTVTILHELAPYLNTVTNRIAVSGHTDTTPYPAQNGATNWDLSADRANAARRALEAGGLAPDKISRIVGLSSSVLFDKKNPRNPINRRISIVVMTQQAEESALATEAVPEPDAAPVTPDATAPGVATPDAKAPDVATSDAKATGVATPEVKAVGVAAPEPKAVGVAAPSVAKPGVAAPVAH